MIINALKYTRFSGEPREWQIEGKEANGNERFAEFGNINLLVGKNASGKSRTLNVICEIAGLVCGQFSVKNVLYPTERFELKLTDGRDIFYYVLDFKDYSIIEEVLVVNGIVDIDRNGGIFPKGMSCADTSIPVVCLKNGEGAFFYRKIVEWGRSLKNYLFSNRVEKDSLVKDVIDNMGVYNAVLIYTVHRGQEMFGKVFIKEIIACMREIGYNVLDFGIDEGKNGYGLYVEEEGGYMILQRDMSQGMYRALSLFTQLIFYCMSQISICVLMDDVGEGLDYERSRALTDILVRKINESNIQVFMTTNDRQVINRIPLKYITVIDRNRAKSVFYNYFNSKDVYDDFKYTGLNNLDFLATDFFIKGFNEGE